MAGVKRKSSGESSRQQAPATAKKFKTGKAPAKGAVQPLPKSGRRTRRDEDDDDDAIIESDTSEEENGFYGFSAKEDEEGDAPDESFAGVKDGKARKPATSSAQKSVVKKNQENDSGAQVNLSSREAHAKQKALARERKASKPNADPIARSKYIWERLRRKSHVSPEERKKLVEELFAIVTGRIKDFVFKHDSVRVIQCAAKYANMTQRKQIADELKGEFKALAESKYAKFLVAKLVVEGNDEIREMIIKEYYGHVKRMINHPEASWILDDIYRQVATKKQKATLLQEWYGPEFALFKTGAATATLSELLESTPEKRKPILDHLHGLINQLLQKKLAGFTMLHDAILQYYLNCRPGSEEATEFLELLKGQGDEEEKDQDILKNLAYTQSGSRVVCMALARGTAKDRRHILRVYKDTVEMLSHDPYGHSIILAAYEVVDDTVGTFKAFFPELIGGKDSANQQDAILEAANHLAARTTLLLPFASATSPAGLPKWLLNAVDISLLEQMHELRATTSKKDPVLRRQELVRSISPPLLEVIVTNAQALSESSFGCQFITEVLLAGEGDKSAAYDAVAKLAAGDPSSNPDHLVHSPAKSRMVKTLIQGGHFNGKENQVHRVAESAGFCSMLFEQVENVQAWATGEGAFILVALVEQQDWDSRSELADQLRNCKKDIEKELSKLEKATGHSKDTEKKGNAKIAGMKLLLEKLE